MKTQPLPFGKLTRITNPERVVPPVIIDSPENLETMIAKNLLVAEERKGVKKPASKPAKPTKPKSGCKNCGG